MLREMELLVETSFVAVNKGYNKILVDPSDASLLQRDRDGPRV